jgi:hypothetical protein
VRAGSDPARTSDSPAPRAVTMPIVLTDLPSKTSRVLLTPSARYGPWA